MRAYMRREEGLKKACLCVLCEREKISGVVRGGKA